MYLKVAPKGWYDAPILIDLPFFHINVEFPLFIDLPFLNQMMITCIATLFIIAGISYFEGNKIDSKGIHLSKKLFATSSTFNIAAFSILMITSFLYAIFW